MKRKASRTSIILILGALTTISPFSIDMYLPAFKHLAAYFNTTVSTVALSISSYFVGLGLGQVFYGPLLDRYGRKQPLYFGLVVYLLASGACLASPSIRWLIAFRFIQALGGCAASVASVALVRDLFSAEEGAKVFSKLMLVLSVSPLFAPTVGGLVAATLGWKAIFIFLAAIVSVFIMLVICFLPDGREPDGAVSLDPASIAREFWSIFRDARFAAYTLSGAFSFAGLFAYISGSPGIFMETFRLNEKQFGLVFAFLSIGLVGAGQLNVLLLRRFSSKAIFKVALHVQLAVAACFAAGVLLGWVGLYAHLLFFFILMSCIGLTYPNAAALALEPFEKNAGSASALLGFLQMSVGALSASLFSVLRFSPSLSLGIVFCMTSFIGLLIFKLERAK